MGTVLKKRGKRGAKECMGNRYISSNERDVIREIPSENYIIPSMNSRNDVKVSFSREDKGTSEWEVTRKLKKRDNVKSEATVSRWPDCKFKRSFAVTIGRSPFWPRKFCPFKQIKRAAEFFIDLCALLNHRYATRYETRENSNGKCEFVCGPIFQNAAVDYVQRTREKMLIARCRKPRIHLQYEFLLFAREKWSAEHDHGTRPLDIASSKLPLKITRHRKVTRRYSKKYPCINIALVQCYASREMLEIFSAIDSWIGM